MVSVIAEWRCRPRGIPQRSNKKQNERIERTPNENKTEYTNNHWHRGDYRHITSDRSPLGSVRFAESQHPTLRLVADLFAAFSESSSTHSLRRL
jgi:hypothetical protein